MSTSFTTCNYSNLLLSNFNTLKSAGKATISGRQFDCKQHSYVTSDKKQLENTTDRQVQGATSFAVFSAENFTHLRSHYLHI